MDVTSIGFQVIDSAECQLSEENVCLMQDRAQQSNMNCAYVTDDEQV